MVKKSALPKAYFHEDGYMNSELHPSIVALGSLSASIAAKHPNQGSCQIDHSRQYGVSDAQVDLVTMAAPPTSPSSAWA
jgi:hypothetical protein